MSKKHKRTSRNADKRLPLGLEMMLPLRVAIERAERVLALHGSALANGRSEGHQQAWSLFKAALDALHVLWDERIESAERSSAFSFSEIIELQATFHQYMMDIQEAQRNGWKWRTGSKSEHVRTRFYTLARALERRLNALSSVPLDSLDGDGDGGPKQPPTWERITLTPETAGGGRVQLDNHTARIASQVRYDMVTLLVKAKGDTVLGVSMKDERVSKPKREYDALPKWLRDVILPPKKNGGRGYRMLS